MNITCADCQQPTDDFKLLNCFHTLCSNCLVAITFQKDKHTLYECSVCGLVTEVESNGVQSLQVGHKLYCKQHDSSQLSTYCDTCKKPVCVQCTVKNHRDHQHSSWKKVLPGHKEEIKAIMVMMNNNIVDVSQAISRQKLVLSESSKKIKLVETDIISTSEIFHSILDIRKDALTYQLHDLVQEKLKGIKSSQNYLKMLLTQLNSSLSYMEEGLATCNEMELLSLKGNMVRHVHHLHSLCRNSLKYAENDFHVRLVSTPSNMSEICSQFGKVEFSDNVFESARENRTSGLDPTLSLKLSVQRLNIPLFLFTKLKGPCGVALNRKGEIIVAESRGDCITIFSPSGEKLYSFGTCGSAEGEFSFPCAVAVDEIENILVVDGCNNRIQKFAPNGQFLAMSGSRGNGNLQFCEPDGIAINPANKKIYVIDNNSHRVQVLNQDLSFYSTFGSKGFEDGHLYYPWGVACSSGGDVYVTDSGNCCVKVFSAGGQFLREFGSRGDIESCLKWPTGIWVTRNNTVYVNEYGNHRISVFTLEGHFLKCFGKKGTSWDEFGNLRGVTVDNNGLVYVCDTDNNRIALY